MKTIELISFSNPDALAQAAASAWLDEIKPVIGSGTPYCVALSGGRVTQKFFTDIVTQAGARKMADGFAKIFIFSGLTNVAFPRRIRKVISRWPTSCCSRR